MKTVDSSNSTKRTEKSLGRKTVVALLTIGFFVVVGAVSALYLVLSDRQIYIERSSIEAPVISLSSSSGGMLKQFFVKAGDRVEAYARIAQVGNDIVTTSQSGVILSTANTLGKNVAPNETVATVIRPDDLRVVAQAEEDKGLRDIRVGQSAYFTVDAFGSKQFPGIVDEVSPTSRSGDIVFNISNTREEQRFDVKIRFDQTAYPELEDGMSAKVWIFKK